jgi:plastocyanin
MTRALLVALTLAAGAMPAAAAPLRVGTLAATTTVKVRGTEFRFALSRRSAPPGTIVFRFTNKGHIPHDFKIAGKKTPLLKPDKSATLKVKLKRGRYRYLCTVPGHAAAGMRGVFTVK